VQIVDDGYDVPSWQAIVIRRCAGRVLGGSRGLLPG